MTHSIRFATCLASCLLFTAGVNFRMEAQAISPVYIPSTGFHLPESGGQLSYALSASQNFVLGYNGADSNVYSTNVSGDFAYLSNSEKHPFSMIYAGGYLGSESSAFPSSSFQNLSLSEEFRSKTNTLIAADTVSYLPQSPVSGLSGIPGVGDLGTAPVYIGGNVGPGILTNYATRVTNIVSLTDSYAVTGKTFVQATGSYGIERFMDSANAVGFDAYNNDQFSVLGGVTHRISVRNAFGVNYTYSHFRYGGQDYTFDANGLNLGYIHNFTPRLVLDVSIGPQWNGSTLFSSGSVNLAALASLTYSSVRSSLTASYSRGANTGSGVVEGALLDTAGVTARHDFSRTLSGAVTGSYVHSASLPNLIYQPFDINSVIFGGQANRALGRLFSVYGSYTFERQTSANYLANSLAFNGQQQIIGFGVTFSPRPFRLGRS